jgi:putative transposase
MSPDEAWEAHRVTGWSEDRVEAEDLSALFRPAIKRKTNRGLIDLFGNTYHHSRLEHWHGEDVLVAYDIHDAGKVWVHEIDRTADGYYMGRLICVAAWNAHVASYYPVSLAEKSHQQKIDMKTKRFQVHMDRAEEERRPILVDDGPADMDPDVAEAVEAMGKALEAPEVADRPRLTLVTDEPPPSIAAPKPEALADPDARPKLTDDISWARWLMDNPERWEKHDHEGMAELCRDRGFRLLAGTKGLDLTALDALVRAKRAEASQPDTEDQKECADHAS